jgi:hypothetical protein
VICKGEEMGIFRTASLVMTIFIVLTMHACKSKSPNDNKKQNLREIQNYSTLDATALAGFAVDSKMALENNAEALMALSQSGLGRSIASKLALKNATDKGILPQILAPSVRSEIASNSMLGFLQNLPPILASSLLDQFASDTALMEKIRSSLMEKINRGLASFGGSTLAARVPFQFDHFVRSTPNSNSFSAPLQAAYWNLAWSQDGLWTGAQPLDGVDHGLQLVNILRTLSEWSYIYGINGEGAPAPFGGLMKKWSEGSLAPSNPVAISDPSIESMVFTGEFSVSVPAGLSALNLATQGGEVWRSNAKSVPLLSQASIWLAAAKAFGRMRADRRANANGLFKGGTPLLTAGAAKLPLLFLKNMAKMLDGPFIDESTQKIFKEACSSQNCQTADAKSVARLVEALSEWIRALDNARASGLEAGDAEKINAGIPSLKKALQLAMRTLSGELTSDVFSPSGHWLTVAVSSEYGNAPGSVSAEVIGTMAEVERNTLNSPLLKLRIISLANGHAKIFFGSKGSLGSKEEILWNARMIRELEPLNSGTALPWLPAAKAAFKRALGTDWVGN